MKLSPKISDIIKAYQREVSNTLRLSKRFLQLTQKALQDALGMQMQQGQRKLQPQLVKSS